MNFKIAFYIIMFFYGIDSLILTPYVLFNGLGRESGLVCSWGYNLIGLSFFYIWTVILGILLWFGLKFLFKGIDSHVHKYSECPKYAMVLTVVVIIIYTIINNLQFIN